MIVASKGGGIEDFIKCFTEYDPAWVETMYLTIVRQNQMEELRMIPEDEWPAKDALEGYHSAYEDDIDYYHPDDLVYKLAMWLRDRRIRERKNQVQQKNKNRAENIRSMLG